MADEAKAASDSGASATPGGPGLTQLRAGCELPAPPGLNPLHHDRSNSVGAS